MSYSHDDREPVSRIATGLSGHGHNVWWDRRLAGGDDFGAKIESALLNAECAVVAWSKTARNSLWVRAEATMARESGKLVQLSLDGARPQLPFNILHLLDFSGWKGDPGEPSFVELNNSVESVLRHDAPTSERKDITLTRYFGGEMAPDSHLGGFGRTVAVGGASLALVILAAGLVILSTTGKLSSSTFGFVSGGMLLAAILAFVYMLTRVIATYRASK